jgi:hypothetical protein
MTQLKASICVQLATLEAQMLPHRKHESHYSKSHDLPATGADIVLDPLTGCHGGAIPLDAPGIATP